MTEKVVSLQWLRALAAWMVVFHHYIQVYRDFEPENKIEAFFTYHGSLGVDIFFVLSGLVMAMSISRGHVSAARFCRDRATRIIPAYWLATMVFLAVLPFANWDAVSFLHGSTLRDVLFSMLFIPHEHASGIGYIPVLTVGWTLNFEMLHISNVRFQCYRRCRFPIHRTTFSMVPVTLTFWPRNPAEMVCDL